MTAPGQTTSAAQGEAAAVAGTAKDEAGNVASTAKGAAGDVAGTAKEQAGQVVGETVEQVKDLTAQVREQAAQQVGTQSEKLAGSLRGLSQQLAQGDTSGVVGQVMGEVGQRVQGLADHLERVGPQGVLEDVRGYARRNPGSFLLGMAFAGFAAGRLTKGLAASKEQQQSGTGARTGYVATPYPEAGYDTGTYAAGTGTYETGTGTYATGTGYGSGAYESAEPYAADPSGTGWTEPTDPRTRGAL